MDTSRPAASKEAPPAGARAPAQVAKAALRRLALAQLEPTPENYAQAFDEELGVSPRPVLPGRAATMIERLASRAFRDDDSRNALVQSFRKGNWVPFERLIERADSEECDQSAALATLFERMVRGLERSDRQWTLARKKEGLQTVLAGSRSDAGRLQQRLTQLLGSWESEGATGPTDFAALQEDAASAPGEQAPSGPAGTASPGLRVHRDPSAPSASIEAAPAAGAMTSPAADAAPRAATKDVPLDDALNAVAPHAATDGAADAAAKDGALPAAASGRALPLHAATTGLAAHAPPPDATPAWAAVVGMLGSSLGRSLPVDDARSAAVAGAIDSTIGALAHAGPTASLSSTLASECRNAENLLQRRNLLLHQMHELCGELTAGLTDLAEDDSWARGQCEAMRAKLDEGLSARGVRSVSALLHTTRSRQLQLRSEREEARDALKSLIHQMLQEVGELGNQTGRFHESVGRYAEVIESADSLESLAGVVREMVAESHTVQALVNAAQQRLRDEHHRASSLAERVESLESELRRLSDEVSTDQLTQIANRRGLMRAFDVERARAEREGCGLALGLLDVDDFKRLNDRLGHSAGDVALKSLAARVQQALRPTDMVARYGGEEFVVMLPDTPIEEAQQVLTRMQRAMTQALFMHESEQVFVTFSAGVTTYRAGEPLEAALDRADEALYEAKRTGKNRTCVA